MAAHFPFFHTFRPLAFFHALFVFALSLALLLPCAEARQNKQNIYAGYRTLSSSLPAQRLMIHMGVWYPTRRRAGNVKVGDWTFRAARNAPVMQGPWPVIILSHDVTGSAWTHHDIAAALAARGFIVAAPTHDHDNGEDMALLFSDRELPVRALQLRTALDLVLEHAQIGKEADRSRIAFLGFGMPASAGLLLAGGELTPGAWPSFCQKKENPLLPEPGPVAAPETAGPQEESLPEAVERDVRPDGSVPPISLPQAVPPKPMAEKKTSDTFLQNFLVTPAYAEEDLSPEVRALLRPSDSPWCAPFLSSRMDELVASMKHRSLEREEKTVMMHTAMEAHRQLFRRLSDSVARSHQRQLRLAKSDALPTPPVALPLLPPLSHNTPVADARFKAMVFVSPGFSMLFSKESLAAVNLPSLFIGAENDAWNRPEEQAERFVDMLGHKPEYLLLKHADAPSLQAPCPASDPAGPLASLCNSVEPETRDAIHARLVSILQEFFNRVLGRENAQ
ncbi:dienelactone hydrolase family protein [Mailhella massiliensis]|uniref:Dienelactone hydrolase family protein n=1 Tax=Mailhella massiliensis TaxID=1903261 RepID=A0A921DSK8_9BACT|nr:dienelactone hydrolase family protein [Mailhella massiliensis]HJD98256.1 dienelactone hydrolase family protein [Mailhella massiliensis]